MQLLVPRQHLRPLPLVLRRVRARLLGGQAPRVELPVHVGLGRRVVHFGKVQGCLAVALQRELVVSRGLETPRAPVDKLLPLVVLGKQTTLVLAVAGLLHSGHQRLDLVEVSPPLGQGVPREWDELVRLLGLLCEEVVHQGLQLQSIVVNDVGIGHFQVLQNEVGRAEVREGVVRPRLAFDRDCLLQLSGCARLSVDADESVLDVFNGWRRSLDASLLQVLGVGQVLSLAEVPLRALAADDVLLDGGELSQLLHRGNDRLALGLPKDDIT